MSAHRRFGRGAELCAFGGIGSAPSETGERVTAVRLTWIGVEPIGVRRLDIQEAGSRSPPEGDILDAVELNWAFIRAQLPEGWRELAIEMGLIHPVPPQLHSKITDIEPILPVQTISRMSAFGRYSCMMRSRRQ